MIDISHLCKKGTNLVDFDNCLLGDHVKVVFSNITFPWPNDIHSLDEDIAFIKLGDEGYSIDIGVYHVFSEVVVSLCYSSEIKQWTYLHRIYVDITRYDKLIDAIKECYNLWYHSQPRYLKWLIFKEDIKEWFRWKILWRLENLIFGKDKSPCDIRNKNFREKFKEK